MNIRGNQIDEKQRLSNLMLLTVALGTLVISTSFYDPINLPKLIAISTTSPLILLALVRTIQAHQPLRTLLRDKVKVLFLTSLLLIVIIAVASPAPIERRILGIWGRNNGLLTGAISILISWSAYEVVRNGENLFRILRISLFVLLPSAVYGLIQVANLDPINWSSGTMRVFATFGNTNFASAAWGLGAILSLLLLLFKSDNSNLLSKKKAGFILLFLIFSYLTVATKSIQGTAAIAVFVTLLVILKTAKMQRLVSRAISILLSLFSILVVHSVYFSGPLSSFISDAGSLGFRKIYWKIGLKMFEENPIFGVGVDSYGDFYRQYRDSQMATTTSIDLVVNNAHNTFLQTLATLGIVGGIAFILPVFLTFVAGVIFVFKNAFEARTGIFAAFVAIWLMASFSIDNISITLWNWMFLGLFLGLINPRISSSQDTSIRKKAARRPQKNGDLRGLYDIGKVIAFSTMFMMFIFLWNLSSADRLILDELRKPVSFSNPETVNSRLLALGDVAETKVLDPQHFATIGRAFFEMQQKQQASEVLEKAVKKFKNDFGLWDYYAYSLEQQGKFSNAVDARQKQLGLDPRHSRIWLYLAEDSLKVEELSKAKFASQKAMENIGIFSPQDQISIKNALMQLNLNN